MAAFVSLLAASVRIASLNLCSDEYLLLLARPGEVASVTRLAQDSAETPLAPRARTVPGNRGGLEDVVEASPDAILTMGGGGRASAAIASALHLRVVILPQPSSIGDVIENLRRVATLLGDPRRAEETVERIERLRETRHSAIDTIWIGGGGVSLSPASLGAQWLGLAGLRQRSLPQGRATIETLLTRPPAMLIVSNYRAGQASQPQHWLSHPLLRHLTAQTYRTDGRRWTCAGPLMIDEVERLRRILR